MGEKLDRYVDEYINSVLGIWYGDRTYCQKCVQVLQNISSAPVKYPDIDMTI
jgi:hypothetical protein